MDFQALAPRVDEAAQLMGLLSQPARLKILCILFEGEQSVLALAKAVDLSQPAMSHHLRKLRDANVVATRRDGQTIFYRLNGKEISAVLKVLHRLYC
ncbi:MAG: ArsR/SmtB family transcription factor [Burkholderiaceae bacterium]